MTRSMVAQMSSDQIYFQFSDGPVASTGPVLNQFFPCLCQPFPGCSVLLRAKSSLLLTQKANCSPEHGLRFQEASVRQGFQTLEFHPPVMRRSSESQGAPRSWVLAPCPLQGPILQASPRGVTFSWSLDIWKLELFRNSTSTEEKQLQEESLGASPRSGHWQVPGGAGHQLAQSLNARAGRCL